MNSHHVEIIRSTQWRVMGGTSPPLSGTFRGRPPFGKLRGILHPGILKEFPFLVKIEKILSQFSYLHRSSFQNWKFYLIQGGGGNPNCHNTRTGIRNEIISKCT